MSSPSQASTTADHAAAVLAPLGAYAPDKARACRSFGPSAHRRPAHHLDAALRHQTGHPPDGQPVPDRARVAAAASARAVVLGGGLGLLRGALELITPARLSGSDTDPTHHSGAARAGWAATRRLPYARHMPRDLDEAADAKTVASYSMWAIQTRVVATSSSTGHHRELAPIRLRAIEDTTWPAQARFRRLPAESLGPLPRYDRPVDPLPGRSASASSDRARFSVGTSVRRAVGARTGPSHPG